MAGAIDPTCNEIVKSTRLLVFFATPHRGGNHASVGEIAANIAKLFSGTAPSNDLLRALRKNSNEATTRFEQSRNIFANCSAITFFETKSYHRAGLVRPG